MKKTFAIALLCAMPTFSMANPHHARGDRGLHAEQDRRGEVRMLLGKIKEDYPKKYEYLMKLREEDPMAFRHAMGEMMRKKGMGDFGHKNPEIMEEKAQLKELKEDFRSALEDHKSASESDKTKHRKELVEMAEELFEAKQKLRRMRVQLIAEDLKKLETEIAERDASREALIEEFVDEKIGASLKGL
jgi:chromosome segregation ATPase